MAKSSIHQKSVEELNQLLQDSLLLSFKLRIQKSTQQLNQVNQIKSVRRDIARYKTALSLKGVRV